MTLPFSGQVALVTGASGGIGGALAEALAGAGAHVCLVGRDVQKLEALCARLTGAAPLASACPADLTRPEDIARLGELVEQRFGRLDILVHSAGAISHGRLDQASVDDLDVLYAANVRAPYALTRALLPLLKRPQGQVVFINSSTGLTARAGSGQFSATQHALKAMADSLREEVNAECVRVLSVFPGRTATPRIAALHEREGRTFQPEVLLQPGDIASVVLSALALPWTAEVTNISIRPMKKSY